MGFMSNVQLGRPLFVLLAMLVGLVLIVPVVRAGIAIGPEAMTVTVALDKAAYLSGDTAKANAIVYRTPVPANYTYTWTVRDTFFRVLNTTAGGATYSYPIPLNYTGRITVDARVDDGQGSIVTGRQTASVVLAVMALRLDRGEYNPGETITASYSVASHVIQRPTYDYEVEDRDLPVPDGPRRDRELRPLRRDRRGPDLRGRPRPPVPPAARRGPRAVAAHRWREPLWTEGRAALARARPGPGPGVRSDVDRVPALREAGRDHDEQAADRGHVPVVRRDAGRHVEGKVLTRRPHRARLQRRKR